MRANSVTRSILCVTEQIHSGAGMDLAVMRSSRGRITPVVACQGMLGITVSTLELPVARFFASMKQSASLSGRYVNAHQIGRGAWTARYQQQSVRDWFHRRTLNECQELAAHDTTDSTDSKSRKSGEDSKGFVFFLSISCFLGAVVAAVFLAKKYFNKTAIEVPKFQQLSEVQAHGELDGDEDDALIADTIQNDRAHL
ncbi:hypothetical protein ACLOJK_032268 [Asimina triloba]